MGLLDTLLGHAGEKSVEKLAEDFAPLLARAKRCGARSG